MQNLQVEFSFKGKAKWVELWRLLTKGKVFSFLTEGNILTIWKQYTDYKKQEQLYRQQSTGKTVAK